MENIETYWEVLSCIVSIAVMWIKGYLFCRLVRPFFEDQKNMIAEKNQMIAEKDQKLQAALDRIAELEGKRSNR